LTAGLFLKACAPHFNFKQEKGKIMWRNYLLIAVRSLAKSRLFTALNLVGLAVGMAACLLIAMWVKNEMTYDQWLPNADRVFVVQAKAQYPGKDAEIWAGAPAVMLPALLQDFPQIEAGTRLLKTARAIRLGNRIESQPLVLVDTAFFDVFQLPLVEGSTDKVLKQPDQIAVSERFARKWFGAASAIGQILTVTVKGEKRPYQIAAVTRDTPSNSVFEFDVIMPLVEKELGNPQQAMQWGAFSGHAVVKLKNASDAASVNAGADGFIGKHAPQFVKVEDGFFYRPSLQNITDTHLQSPPVNGYYRPAGDSRLVTALAATGILILIIATITYINLATARVSLRAREVGLRKTLGAARHQLMLQFLVESTLLALLAGILALAMVELALPAFNALLAQKLIIQYLGAGGVLLPLVVMVGFVGIVGGWYPALVLTKLKPREAISGYRTGSGSRLRQLLVIGQFSIAVLLMTSMAIVYLQVSHLRSADMGYNPEGLIVIGQLQRAEVRLQQQNLLDAVKRVPGVTAVTRSAFDPTGTGLWRQQAFRPGVPDAQAPQFSVQMVDWGYLKAYDGRLLAGRDLSEEFANDNYPDSLPLAEAIKRGGNVLINRAALKSFNTSDPRAVIGKTFQVNVGRMESA
jgi:putative ABC transport system permease protein